MSFDVSTVEVADTFPVTINNPTTNEPFMVQMGDEDDGEGGKRPVNAAMSVTVYGPGSKQFKAAQSVSRAKYMTTFSRGKSRETDEQEAARTATFLASCTVSLNNFSYKGMPANEAPTFKALYSDPKMGWLTEQVNAEMGDWANFTRAAPGS